MVEALKTTQDNFTNSVFADKLKSIAKRIEGIFFPLLLCMVMMSAVLYIYTGEKLDRNTIFAAILCTGFFALFSKLKKIRFGGLLYFLLLMVITPLPGFLIRGWVSRMNFVQWFFSGAEAVETRSNFLITLIILFSFFFSSVIFYFTQAIYRSSAVVLISLIPLALSVKVVYQLPFYYSVILAAINLILFIFYSRKEISDKCIRNSKAATLMVYTDFAAAAVLLAIIAPKPSTTPFYDQFEGFMNRFQFGVPQEAVLSGEYNSYSGNADDLLNQESRLLYILNTIDPTYMKIQVFDFFDPEFNRWSSEDDQIRGKNNWQETAELMNYEKLSAAIQKAAEYDPSLYEQYPSVRLLEGITETESFSVVYPSNFPAVYAIAPLRSRGINLSNTGAKFSYRSQAGEIFTDLEQLPPSASYTVRYYSENILSDEMLENGACDISAEDYGKMLEKVSDYLNIHGDTEEYNVAKAFLDEHSHAMEYAEYTASSVSPEIQELSDSITEGLEYDYQKAKAIEQYFHNNDFVYSLGYEAPEESDTTEFFLFESKTGTCSDFASAYTRLARAAGLTVRYAEGFVPQAGDDPREGIYYIMTENAHAYPEVYIPGAGWVRYEPTVANLINNSGSNNTNNEMQYYTFLFTAIIFTIGIGIFILLIILRPKIIEGIFRLTVKFMNNESAIKSLYNRHAKMAGARYGVDPSAMTAEEVSILTAENTGIPLEPLSASFTEICYGGRTATKESRDLAYECYISQANEMKRKKKKQKE